MDDMPNATDYERGVAEFSPKLKAYLTRRLGSEEDAEDALQDILYNLFRTAGDDLEGIVNLPAWLFRSARNLLSNIGRRQRAISFANGDLLSDILADSQDEQETAVLRQAFWSELEKALAELPEEQRRIWEMTEFEGLPVKEIARLTGICQATLLSRKHYAVTHLRKRLERLYDDIINE